MSRSNPASPFVGAYRITLWLYPAEFRCRFARSMLRDFRCLLGEAHGRFGRLRVLLRECANVVRGAAQHRRGGRHRATPNRPGAPPGFTERVWQMRDDLHVGARNLRSRPVYTAIAIITLALGTGAGTVVFGLVDAVLLKSLPHPEPDRLVAIMSSDTERGWERMPVSAADYLSWRETSHSFEEMGAHRAAPAVLTGGSHPERIRTLRVTPNTFTMLGSAPARGRTFTTADLEAGSTDLVVLGHALWQNLFDGESATVGKTIRLDGREHTVIGIMPPEFRYPEYAPGLGLWRPLSFSADEAADRATRNISVHARLASGVSIAQAGIELSAIADRLALEHPESNAGWGVSVLGYRDQYLEDFRPVLWLLSAAAFVLQVLACVNIAGLVLARGISRQHEIATRVALGAGRARIIRLLLSEGVLLATAGALVAVFVAQWGLVGVLAVAPTWPPTLSDAALGGRAFVFAFGMAALAAVAFSLAPALRLSRPDLRTALGDGGRTAGEGPGHQRVRSALVAAQISAALVLLVGSGLLVRTALTLMGGDLGFDHQGILTARVFPSGTGGTYYPDLLEQTAALPGVNAAALADVAPQSGSDEFAKVSVDGEERPSPAGNYGAIFLRISDTYFQTLGIPVSRGRGLRPEDRLGSRRVAVVNERFARHYLGDANPIGHTVQPREGTFREGREAIEVPWEIVGVVRDVRSYGFANGVAPIVYLPYEQTPHSTMALILRAGSDIDLLGQPLRELVWRFAGGGALGSIRSVESHVADYYETQHFLLALVGGFAVLGSAIAMVGLYGVMAYGVQQRLGELALRLALGAVGRDLFQLLIRRGLTLTTIATLVGIVGAFPFAYMLSRIYDGRLLIGVSWVDPVSLLAVSALLVFVALFACVIPARHAARVDPVTALRSAG